MDTLASGLQAAGTLRSCEKEEGMLALHQLSLLQPVLQAVVACACAWANLCRACCMA